MRGGFTSWAMVIAISACGAGPKVDEARIAALEARLAQLQSAVVEAPAAASVDPGRPAHFEQTVCDRIFPKTPPPPPPANLPTLDEACGRFADLNVADRPERTRSEYLEDCKRMDANARKREGDLVADMMRACLMRDKPEEVLECMSAVRPAAVPNRKWNRCIRELNYHHTYYKTERVPEIMSCYAAANTEEAYDACENRANAVKNRVDDPDRAASMVERAKEDGEAILDAIGTHGCPPLPAGTASGAAGPTPPLSLNCPAEDLSGDCRPWQSKTTVGEAYPETLWTEDAGWKHVAFRKDRGHRFHYEFTWTPSAQGCEVAVRLHGDLDADGTHAVYERTARFEGDQLVRGDWKDHEGGIE